MSFVAWLPALLGGFHYDDLHSIVNNPYISSLVSSGDPTKVMIRPGLMVTYWIDHHLGSWHLTNLMIHLANGLLRPAMLVHPICAEPVNYISARSESLSLLCCLLAVRVWPSRWAWVVVAVGMTVKETALTIPLILLATFPGDWRRMWPALGLWGGWWAVAGSWAEKAVFVRGPWEQLATQTKGLMWYAWKVAFPANLSVDPQFQAGFGPEVLLSGLCFASLLVVWRPPLLLWMLPTFLMPLNILVSEKRAYVLAALFPRMPKAVTVVFAVLALLRTLEWQSDLRLWQTAVDRGSSSRSHIFLGQALRER